MKGTYIGSIEDTSKLCLPSYVCYGCRVDVGEKILYSSQNDRPYYSSVVFEGRKSCFGVYTDLIKLDFDIEITLPKGLFEL